MVLLFPYQWQGEFQVDRKELPQVYPQDVVLFFSSLTEGLDKLDKAFLSEGCLSLSFMRLALEFLRSTHAAVVLVAEKLKLPAFCKSEHWLNEYMDETVKLLDVCNVLKSGIANMEHYHVMVDAVVRALETISNLRQQGHRAGHALIDCKQELLRMINEHRLLVEQKIEAEGKLLVLDLSDRHIENKFVKWNGFWGVLSSVKFTNSHICRLLLSTLVYSDPRSSFISHGVNVRASWAKTFRKFQLGVVEEVVKTRSSRKCRCILLNEIEVLETVLEELRAKVNAGMRGHGNLPEDVENVRCRAAALEHSLQQFQTGIETVDWHLNDLFDEVVEGRNKLLNLASQC